MKGPIERALERDLATPPVTGEVGELVSLLRTHRVYCTAPDGRFETAAAMLERYAAVAEAAQALIDDVKRRYPGEELRCEYMRALDAALSSRCNPR